MSAPGRARVGDECPWQGQGEEDRLG